MALRISRLRARPLDRRRLLTLAAAAAVAACGDKDTGPGFGWSSDGGQDDELDPISGNDVFYTLWFKGSPGDVDAETWACAVIHDGVTLGSFDLARLGAMAAREREHTLQCVESRPGFLAMDNAVWTGAPLIDVLAAADIAPPETAWVVFRCADTYSVAVPAADLTDGPLWLVWGMNGETLPLAHGFPARVLTPGRYGWLNPKQVTSIEFTDAPYEPDWMPDLMARYEAQGVAFDRAGSLAYQVQSLLVQPTALEAVGGKVFVLGKAYAGTDPVVEVEVSTDGGSSWQAATLTYAPGADVWALWRFVWEPDAAGRTTLMTRARTASGQQCTPDLDANRIPWPGGMAVEVIVEAG
jgi:DMSO/TMAO reductase YedYZ molybdopterin-dependent catalytic subunit